MQLVFVNVVYAFQICLHTDSSVACRSNLLLCSGLFFQVRHVILLLCQFVNHLEVTHLPVYRPTEKECSDPKLYANNVRTVMAAEVRQLACGSCL